MNPAGPTRRSSRSIGSVDTRRGLCREYTYRTYSDVCRVMFICCHRSHRRFHHGHHACVTTGRVMHGLKLAVHDAGMHGQMALFSIALSCACWRCHNGRAPQAFAEFMRRISNKAKTIVTCTVRENLCRCGKSVQHIYL